MAGRKRLGERSTCIGTDKKTKRQITVKTFERWQGQYNAEYQSLSWLRCDRDQRDRTLVSLLWCVVCRKYEANIRGYKNFSKSWIEGTSNQRTSNVIDHATSAQHKAAMGNYKAHQARDRNEPLASYAPIASSLVNMDAATKARMKRKFDICFVMAKEGLSFSKYPALFDLESRHDVDLGLAYRNDVAARSFTQFIAESQRRSFLQSLSSTNFVSFLMDGTTDAGNLEDELFVALYCKKDDVLREIRSCARYLSVVNPEKADADGLVKCVQVALKRLEIEDVLDRDCVLGTKPVLVGGGTDGASVNISQHSGLKGKMQDVLPWLFWAWCFAHRLELASKNGLTSKLFKDIEEMLLRLYYLYEKSPKKTRELASIVEDLKEVFELSKGGNVPIRSQGSRWITHKRKALQRVVDRFGVYIVHLTTLAEDKSLKSQDRARLRGYLHKWSHAKVLVGCAMFVEVLKPPSFLSLSLQGADIDIVFGIKQILKTSTTLKSLMKQDPLQWPTVQAVLSRVKDEGSSKTYQGATLTGYNSTTLEYCKKEALADLERLNEKLRERLEWSDVTLLRAVLVFLETQSWMKRSSDGESGSDVALAELKSAVECIVVPFRDPLEARGANLSVLQDEIEDAVDYARRYLALENTGYRKVWYNLQVCPDSCHWPNLLLLCELVFSLPFSNGRVEQIFSSLKVLKTTNRTSLRTSTLDDLLEIFVEGPPLSCFSADQAVELWWRDCCTTRRVNQGPRRTYRPRRGKEDLPGPSTVPDHESDSEDSEVHLALDDWDEWFHCAEDSDVHTSDHSQSDSD